MDIQTLDSSGFTMKTELNYANPWSRIGASLLDGLILLPLTAVTLYNTYFVGSLLLLAGSTLILILYKPVFEATKSATLGKMILKMKVVQGNGTAISTDQAIQRFVPWVISYILAFIGSYLLFSSPQYQRADGFLEVTQVQSALPMLTTLNIVNGIYSAVFIGLLISLAVDRRHQGWHDKWAKTFVVRANKDASTNSDLVI